MDDMNCGCFDQKANTKNVPAAERDISLPAAVDLLKKESKSALPDANSLGANESQKKLNQIINKLSEDSTMIDDHNEEMYIRELKNIYTDTRFRHSYSELTRIILKCYDNGDKQHTLETNFQRLHEKVETGVPCKKDDEFFIKGFRKLYDHFNLEIARLRYMDGMKASYENKLETANNKIESYDIEIKHCEAELKELTEDYTEKIDKKFNDASSQSMTLLGIFSAIAFSFTGGFGIIGSTFNNGINSPHPLRFIFTILLLSFSLFNILMGLLSSLFKLSMDKEMALSCKYANQCTAKDSNNEKCNHCNMLKRVFRRYPLISIVNSILIIGMGATFILWLAKFK